MIEITHTLHHKRFPELRRDIEPLIEKVETATDTDRADLIFSGFDEVSDLEEIDRKKLADTSAEHRYLDVFLEDEDRMGREYLNSHQILVDKYMTRLDSLYPDPDRRTKKLGLLLLKTRSEEKQERIRQKINEINESRDQTLRKREAGYRYIDRKLRETPLMPVYYGGDIDCLMDHNSENNPLAYATSGYTGNGFLACYSKPLLEESGVEINWLNEKTPRTDRQLFMIADHTMMSAGQIALVRIRDGAKRETIEPSIGYLPNFRQL